MTPDDVPGWDTGIAELYREVAEECEDGDILVELGVWLGRSIARLATYCKYKGKRPRIVGIDAFDGRGGTPVMRATAAALGGDIHDQVLYYLRECGVADMIELRRGDTAQAAADFADNSVAVVLVDAGHEYEDVRADIEAWAPKVRPGGLLAGHDASYPGVRDAVNEFFGHPVKAFGFRGCLVSTRDIWRIRK